jgi:uncharacterized protein
LGHSEGGLVAEVAATRATDICGIVLAAASGRPLGQVLRAQLKANSANSPILEQALGAIDKLEAGQTFDVSGMHPALLPLFRPQVQRFLISMFTLKPEELLRDLVQLILILQGEKDLQTDKIDAKLLAGANARTQLVLLSDANHVLKSVSSDETAANFATHANPDLPLAPGVVEAIAKFISENASNGR